MRLSSATAASMTTRMTAKPTARAAPESRSATRSPAGVPTTAATVNGTIIAAMAPQHALPAVVETFQRGGFTSVSARTDPKIYITPAR
jgi:hypothetical protein